MKRFLLSIALMAFILGGMPLLLDCIPAKSKPAAPAEMPTVAVRQDTASAVRHYSMNR